MNPTGKRSRITSMVMNSWLTLLFTAWVLVMLWSAESIGRVSAWIPQLVLCTTLLFLLGQLVKELRASWRLPPDASVSRNEGRVRRTVAATGWLLLLLMATWLFGAVAASTLFCLTWLRWHAGESWWMSLVIATTLGLVLWVIFSTIPGSNLYPGVLLLPF